MKTGSPIPDAIADAPELWPGLELYYIAFMELIASRHTGFSLGPIWWETIDNYASRKELDEEQREALHHHIVAMDAAYLKHHEKKMSKNGHGSAIQQKHQVKK